MSSESHRANDFLVAAVLKVFTRLVHFYPGLTDFLVNKKETLMSSSPFLSSSLPSPCSNTVVSSLEMFLPSCPLLPSIILFKTHVTGFCYSFPTGLPDSSHSPSRTSHILSLRANASKHSFYCISHCSRAFSGSHLPTTGFHCSL